VSTGHPAFRITSWAVEPNRSLPTFEVFQIPTMISSAPISAANRTKSSPFSDEYAQERAALIHPERRHAYFRPGMPVISGDTVQFCAADRNGNAVSMVNSIYINFGSGIVPEGLGFALQNRGCSFSLLPEHPNCAGPGKRPYHTIIPCLTTNADGSLHGVHGVMGGFMQPQGHVQILSAMLDDGLDPQAALNRPRFCVNPDDTVSLEEGMPEETMARLISMGHPASMVSGYARKLFGRGQIILTCSNGFYEGGSDPRSDGCVFGL
jgi:gamma-glutamyltranspeptidase/glutathione hydrolase